MSRQNVSVSHDEPSLAETLTLGFSPTGDPAIDVYIEQISASITSLWAYYTIYFPEERNTLRQILTISQRLVQLRQDLLTREPTITRVRQENAIISGLVELSASLSYSVTQGTTGASPILDNRSPFPHHSLLGVGGSIRAITKFIRYLEKAFKTRSAADVITRHYSTKRAAAPVRISNYMSGPLYSFDVEEEEFDTGGDFISAPDVPLLAHFSLRHGFKEAKFSVTAASESLTAECLPPWTLMTLSHETMHSRVRHIFQALFGTTWRNDDSEAQWDTYFSDFSEWFKSKREPLTVPLSQAIRNVVLHFCLMTEREEIVPERRPLSQREIDRDDLLNAFIKHKRLASELFVHFHDYYFAYACQRTLYVMSLWASWTTVAAPVAHAPEYLVRTLATIACGTGSTPRAAFNGAVDTLEEGLAALEAAGIQSPIFQELRSLLTEPTRRAIYAFFKPAYYLIDHVRMYFA
ncbi:MAG TPA: hypothetical protein VN843_19065, partial [Anaerolineales bacterium]|nr:hypothetical protein [Anaerolineales bacterium]